MIALIPYSAEVLNKKLSLSNITIIGLCVMMGIGLAANLLPHSFIEALVLDGWGPLGLIGHMFLHGSISHLFFNMLALWVFGNAVCEKVGNLAYLGIFFATGLFAAAVHNIMTGGPAVGASGAISGMVGFYLILYPLNRVNCFYAILIRFGTTQITGFWLIILWFLLDAWGALSDSQDGIAYWAHLGGTLAGVVIGVIFVKRGMAPMARYDNPTLLDLIVKEKQIIEIRKTPPKARKDSSTKLATNMVTTMSDLPSFNESPQGPDVLVNCPHCLQELAIPPSVIGTPFNCPTCDGSIEIEN